MLIALPIASNLGAQEDLGGVGNYTALSTSGPGIYANITDNRPRFQWLAGASSNQRIMFTFTYRII